MAADDWTSVSPAPAAPATQAAATGEDDWQPAASQSVHGLPPLYANPTNDFQRMSNQLFPQNFNAALGFMGPGPGSVYSLPELMGTLTKGVGTVARNGAGLAASAIREGAVDLPSAAAEWAGHHFGIPGLGFLTRSVAKPALEAFWPQAASHAAAAPNAFAPLAYQAARGEQPAGALTRALLALGMRYDFGQPSGGTAPQ